MLKYGGFQILFSQMKILIAYVMFLPSRCTGGGAQLSARNSKKSYPMIWKAPCTENVWFYQNKNRESVAILTTLKR